MSFASEVKAELCKTDPGRRCCARAELYGALLYANSFSATKIRLVTESEAFAGRLPQLLKRTVGETFDRRPEEGAPGRKIFELTNPQKIRAVFAAFGEDADYTLRLSINLAVLENDCDRIAFLRGAFLAGGHVTDPAKRYHMELVTGHSGVCGGTVSLLQELGLEARSSRRNGNYLTYFKQAGAIEDFFTGIGASRAAMRIMESTAEKDMTNAMNRLINCDLANADKVTEAARRQLEVIRALDTAFGLDALPPVLQDTALLRIANPECSLSDLAMLAVPPVSKSCMNHRMRKLMEWAEQFSATD